MPGSTRKTSEKGSPGAGSSVATFAPKGEPGTPLRAAFEAYVEARDAWEAFRARRLALTRAYRFQRAIDSRLYGDGRGMTRAWMALIEARRDVAAGVKRTLNQAIERAETSPLPDPSTVTDKVFARPEDLDTPHHK